MRGFVFGLMMMLTSGAAFGGSVSYKTVDVDGLEVFYRVAGSADRPALLLLHGFPTSSQMYQKLMEDLSDDFYLVAPDYPGFGKTEQPPLAEFDYSFAGLTDVIEGFVNELGLQSYRLYVMDYGAPIGFRLALRQPERVRGLVVQNGNAYDEGLAEFWDPVKKFWQDPSPANAAPLGQFVTPAGVEWQYTHGTRNPDQINPDNWVLDAAHLSRPENPEIQTQLFYSYRTNVPLYAEFQAYFRRYQPPTLIVWGTGDYIFPPVGAHPYLRDLPDAELHLLNTGHFALEEDGDKIAELIKKFF